MPHLRLLVLPLLLLVVPAANSQSAPIFYDFTVTFDQGDLAGQSFQGSFSLDGNDCPGGLCPDAVFSADFVASTLLSFDITIDGATFDIEDDQTYSFFPLIELQGGNVIYIDYLTSGFVDPHLELFYWPTFGANQAVFQDVDGLESQGTITDVQLQALQAVPEPATLMLFGLGGAGLARHWWQKRG